MLTIKAPITLTINPSIVRTGENFCQRLTANYQMMSAPLTPEDLLHLVAAPPEIYLAEGGMTSLVNSASIYQNQELKLELVNNVLNRILVSDTYRMTYQDQVFISSTLRRLGVTNVQEFMSQVQALRSETRTRNELISLYWENREQLRELTEKYLEHQKEPGKAAEEETQKTETPLYLHQSILNRLQSGAIYQEVSNFLYTNQNSLQIRQTEMQLGEQKILAETILLNKLQNYANIQEEALVYNRVNMYELGDVEQNYTENQELLVKELTQAILLHLTDQMYAIRFAQIFEKKDMWYYLVEALYQSAETTFQRFEDYHSRLQNNRQEIQNYTAAIREYRKKEIVGIREMMREEKKDAAAMFFPEREEIMEEIPAGELPDALVTREFNTRTEGGVEYLTRIRQEEPDSVQKKIVESQTLLKQELDRFNQQNIRTQELLREKTRQTEQRTQMMIDRRQARKDALRALESPEEVVLEYMNRETEVERLEREENETVLEMLSPETREIFRQLERYQQRKELMETERSTMVAQDMLLRDILLQEKEEETVLLQETERHRTEVKEEIAEQVLEKISLPAAGRVQQEIRRQSREEVELIFKQQETLLEEETLEELGIRSRNTQMTRETREEQHVSEHQVEHQVKEVMKEILVDQKEDVARMVTQSLQQQLGRLSDQIYGKMERRLDSERRRRGL